MTSKSEPTPMDDKVLIKNLEHYLNSDIYYSNNLNENLQILKRHLDYLKTLLGTKSPFVNDLEEKLRIWNTYIES